MPEKAEHPLPLIIWIHGGAWKGGDKNTPLGIRFISRGYALASINYRLSGEAKFPAQINDCRAAVRYLRAHAREWGIHPDYIAVWGGSAGGHLVSLLGTTADIKNFDGKDSGPASVSPRVQAVVDWYGPSDAQMPGMFNSSVFKDLIGGSPEEYKEKALLASPILYVSSNSAPFLIMHGEQDHTVSIQHSVRLYEALKKAGVEATYKPIPGAGHGGKEFTKTENLKVIMDFFDRHLMRPILRQMKKQ
ncbi:MAG: alpha/beta hydrolase [Elusimicrobia bacterium]|nr:alpha/beta hydrolase [Elusimicrobiota bacterium]